ncbi:MAG TPA: FAD:protein FMN transferase [Acidimicrobiales bacterium]|nr:FAD:protein FMN transferase [Acidimicrobiales bacterium]
MTDQLLEWSAPDVPVDTVTAMGTTAGRSMQAIGTTAEVIVTDPASADKALALLADDLRALDEACSRFRPDSEIKRLEKTSHGQPVAVSSLLFEAMGVACAVAERTAGTVDPTTGSALVALGYDRDFGDIGESDRGAQDRPVPAPGWWQIALDPVTRTAAIPRGLHIDLGSSAKAWAADRSAARIARGLGCGVLVNLGGDVAVAGPAPTEGWPIGIGIRSDTPSDEADLVLAVFAGGVATSGTTCRTWRHDGRLVHHIVDPWTGEPAAAVWALVSVLAPTCLEANAWSTAAVVWGEDAPGNLAAHGVSARLVRADGDVVTVGRWPTDAGTEMTSFDDTKGTVDRCWP